MAFKFQPVPPVTREVLQAFTQQLVERFAPEKESSTPSEKPSAKAPRPAVRGAGIQMQTSSW